MADQTTRTIPFRSLLYILLCSAVIALFLALTIIPNHLAINELRQEQQDTAARIEQQKVLYPFYKKLSGIILAKDDKALPFPTKTSLARDKIDDMENDFLKAANNAGMDLDLVPEFATLSRDSKILKIIAKAQGDFFDFRRFLIELGKIPYLARIDEIQIQSRPSRNSYVVKCGLALEEQK